MNVGAKVGPYEVEAIIERGRHHYAIVSCQTARVLFPLDHGVVHEIRTDALALMKRRVCRRCTTRHHRMMPRLYRTWERMIRRCHNRNDRAFGNYGGRGVRVCGRWMLPQTGYIFFVADMGAPPSRFHTLDRRNNEGHYTPANCRWATRTEQNRNTRKNRRLHHKGRTQALSAWAEEMGIKSRTISGRLDRGWTIHRALTRKAAPWNR